MNKKNIFITSVTTSVIASIVFSYFIQPIASNVWKFINSYASNYTNEFINGVYSNAALGKRNWLDFIHFSMTNIAIFTFIFAMLIIMIASVVKPKHEENKQNRIKSILNTARHSVLIRIIYCLLLLYTLISPLKMIFSAYVDLQVNASFDQRITIIAPYIDDHEYKIIKSKWSLMTTKNDYEEINHEIDSISKTYKIKIVKPLY